MEIYKLGITHENGSIFFMYKSQPPKISHARWSRDLGTGSGYSPITFKKVS